MTPAQSASQGSTFWDQYAFSVGESDFQRIDVAIAAMAHGDWSAFERRLTEGLACAARAEAEGYVPEDSAIEEAATAFRYDRDLISGAEMSAWLDEVGLSTDEWMAHITREVLRRIWASDMELVLDRFTPSAHRLEAAAAAEGICSGLFTQFEESFAGRASLVFDSAAPTDPSSSPTDQSVLEDAARRLTHQHAHWLTRSRPEDVMVRVMAVLRLEQQFLAASQRLVSTETLGDVLDAHQLAWVRLVVDTIGFPTEDAAREAVLCVKEDGMSLHDVGVLSRRAVVRRELFVEDVPAPQRDLLVSAAIGEVCGPVASDGRFDVSAIVTRCVPALDNARVAERARRAAVEGLTRRAAREHMKRRHG